MVFPKQNLQVHCSLTYPLALTVRACRLALSINSTGDLTTGSRLKPPVFLLVILLVIVCGCLASDDVEKNSKEVVLLQVDLGRGYLWIPANPRTSFHGQDDHNSIATRKDCELDILIIILL